MIKNARRSSNRKKRPPKQDVIDISSDDESVFEDASSPVRSPSPTIASIPKLPPLSQDYTPIRSPSATIADLTPPVDQPRKIGQCISLWPIRISFDNKVFSHECEVRFQTGTSDPYILLAYSSKKNKRMHKIHTEGNDLLEMSYFVEDDEDNDDDFNNNVSSDPINILCLVVDASAENGLLQFCKDTVVQDLTTPDDNTLEDNPSGRKRAHSVATNQIDNAIELRSASEYKEKIDTVMEKCETIRDMFNEKKSKLTKKDAQYFAKPIVDDIALEKAKQFQLEESFVERRVTRSSRKASRSKWKNATDILLVYPFEVKNTDELDCASKGLNQLSISNETCLKKYLSSDIDCKTQYAHYLTVHESDRGRLEQGEFLNDTIIDFWMSW